MAPVSTICDEYCRYPVAPSLRGWGGGCKARVGVRVMSTASRIALVPAQNHIG